VDPARTPVILAAGHSIERSEVVDVIDLAERASQSALSSADGLREKIQRLSMVSVVFSPVSTNPATQLAERLGLADIDREVTTPGGNLPQWLVTRAASQIAEGELDATLIVGAEATRSMRATDPDAPIMKNRTNAGDDASPDRVVGPSISGTLGEVELAIRLYKPTEVYPLFENALAHAEGRSFAEQREFLGPLMSRFSQVAADHPFAWFGDAQSAQQISEVSATNRLVAEPYPKKMNAFPNVDQGCAVVVASLATARDLGLEDRCVFVWSGANNTEPTPATRPNLADAPAMRVASAAALEAAGIGADDLGLIDLYSCFPIAVEIAAKGLGIELDDPRGLTITGGLSFFGGPGNNYSMHAIATLFDRLPDCGGLGYIGANGGLLSKHSIGVYGAEPPTAGFVAADTARQQTEIDAAAMTAVPDGSGDATVVASTLVYERDGSPSGAPVIATLDDGRRVVAKADAPTLANLPRTSLIGQRIRVSGSPCSYQI
jgi:acetyl-CoA C-acetyltransferase